MAQHKKKVADKKSRSRKSAGSREIDSKVGKRKRVEGTLRKAFAELEMQFKQRTERRF